MKSQIPEIYTRQRRFDFTQYQLPKRKMNQGETHGNSCFSTFVFDKVVKPSGVAFVVFRLVGCYRADLSQYLCGHICIFI